VKRLISPMLRCVALLAVGMSFAGQATAVNYFSATSDGKIHDPSGNEWRGAGINIIDDYVYGLFNYTGGVALAEQILDAFPNMNLLRLACFTENACYYENDPSDYADFVTYFTSRNIAVVIEHHDASHTVLQNPSPALTQESAWYATLATYYINNPYVMFQTMNEPGIGDGDQQDATYYAIRNTGNNTLIFFEAGDWALGDYLTLGNTSDFHNMHNVGWDMHSYYSGSNQNSYSAVLADQNSRIANLQTITSADGTMPVISLEGGNAHDLAIDPDEGPRLDITFTNGNLNGYAAWVFNHYARCSKALNILNYDFVDMPHHPTSFTSYGLRVANYIAMRGGNTSQPGATIPGANYLIDPAHNVWTVNWAVDNGAIYKNGVQDVGTHDVELLLYLNGGIYQKANGGNWWSYGNGQWYPNSGDPRLSSYPAPSGSLLTVANGGYLVDGSLNKWTTGLKNGTTWVICKNEVVDDDTANVERLLFYNGVLYQQANGGNWWSYVGGAWNALAGDPRPAPSANGTTIPSATQLSDASRNIWTVSGGVIYQNAAEEVGTQNVTLLLYYNSAIYQQNNAGGWWKYENGGWTPIAGDPRP
jgi:hypothetical protein